ncbi:uncharacterized protein TNCV_4431621 [Trichonephila clavipes]|nr:uncharacterized protein TNCV_4431621 [Trichonephila clavipes]
MIFYDFKAGLNQEECVQQLQLELDDGFPCHATVFRWFEEFFRSRNYLQDEEHTASAGNSNLDCPADSLSTMTGSSSLSEQEQSPVEKFDSVEKVYISRALLLVLLLYLDKSLQWCALLRCTHSLPHIKPLQKPDPISSLSALFYRLRVTMIA